MTDTSIVAPFTRSHGIPIAGGFVVGGGHTGITAELDQLVTEGAQRLAALAGGATGAVTVRFNSDRRSGGAFLRTAERDSVGVNCELGINWGIYPDFDENDDVVPGSERCRGSVFVRPAAMRDDAPDMPAWGDDIDPYVTIPMASNDEAIAWIAANCSTDPAVIAERLTARRAEFEAFAAWPAGVTSAKVRKAGRTGWTFGELQVGDWLVHIEDYGSKPRLGNRTRVFNATTSADTAVSLVIVTSGERVTVRRMSAAVNAEGNVRLHLYRSGA